MKRVIILGAGLAGLSCAYHLKKDYLIFEKENRPGGLCRSVYINAGFTPLENTPFLTEFIFDYTGHLLHLHQSYTKRLLFQFLGKNLKKIKRSSWIYFRQKYVPYPFQANLWALPEKIRNECLKGLFRSPAHPLTRSPASFHDWCLSNYGKGISKYFFFPYNEKIWLRSLREITTDWVNPFIPQISKEEIIEGAKGKIKKNFGYNAYFYYPRKGGIQSLIDVLEKKIRNIHLNSEIKKIDWRKKKIIFANDTSAIYSYLVSTIPLPELLNCLENPPGEIKEARDKLFWTSVLCINLGIKRHQSPVTPARHDLAGGSHQPPIKNCHWIYFPEKEFIFYRVGFYTNFSSTMAPKNCSSLYIEIAYRPEEKLNEEKIIAWVKKDLIRCKILNIKDRILVTNILPIPYAYVVYDKNRNCVLKVIEKFFRQNDIFSVGRYGAWKYSFMEESILDGKSTAEKINESVKSLKLKVES